MKYRMGSLSIEAIDTYVRISVVGIGGPDAPIKHAVTKQQCPTSVEIAELISAIRGYWPDNSVLQACGRAAEDARNNTTVLAL